MSGDGERLDVEKELGGGGGGEGGGGETFDVCDGDDDVEGLVVSGGSF